MADKTYVSDTREDGGSLTKKSVTATRVADGRLTKNSIIGERQKTNAEKSEENIKKKKAALEAKRKAEAEKRENERKEKEARRKVKEEVKRDLESEKPLTASWSKKGGASAKYGVTMYSGHLPAAGAHVVMSAEKPRPFDTQRRPDGKLYAFRPTWIESCTGAVVDAKKTTGDNTGAWVVINEGDFAVKTVTLSDPGKAPTVEYSVSSTMKKSEGLSFSVNVPLTKKEESGRLISLVAGSIMDPSPLYSWGYGDACVDDSEGGGKVLKLDLGVYDANGKFHNTCCVTKIPLGGVVAGDGYTYGPVEYYDPPDTGEQSEKGYRQYIGTLSKGANGGFTFEKTSCFVKVTLPTGGGGGSSWGYGPVTWDGNNDRFIQYKGTFDEAGNFTAVGEPIVVMCVIGHAADHAEGVL